MELKVFGIRHHGPGLANALNAALAVFDPDVILIELPADTQAALLQFSMADFEPPVALLVYDAKQPARASFLPFAIFSPEWQALRYAQKHNRPVVAMDLPMERQFCLPKEAHLQFAFEEDTAMVADPLGFLSQLAGYDDTERWWELFVEQQPQTADVFDQVGELITRLRAEVNRQESTETLLREAHMRTCIREAETQGYQKIAVVCGAWHLPALEHYKEIKPKTDLTAWKATGKVKTAVTWSPWSYERLSVRSGYGAGIEAPIWYETLFNFPTQATAQMLAFAARLMREKKYPSSTADVVEATRLAQTLAHLRGRAQAGLGELREAQQAVLGQGGQLLPQLIENDWLIGQRLGKLPKGIVLPPIQQDLEQAVKTARLSRFYQSTDTEIRTLDLREPTPRFASILLHRLNILDIDWGVVMARGNYVKLSAKEDWQLRWNPDFLPRIIQAGTLGSTILEAATSALQQKVVATQKLGEAVTLFGVSLKADVGQVASVLLEKMQVLSLVEADVDILIETFDWMVQAERYGSVYEGVETDWPKILEELLYRLLARLPEASTNLDTEQAQLRLQRLLQLHQAVGLSERKAFTAAWLDALLLLSNFPTVSPLLEGLALRLRFEAFPELAENIAQRMRFRLGYSTLPEMAAAWLEGFLQQGAVVLMYHPMLRQLMNDWLEQLEDEVFLSLLPLLRRTSSAFSGIEKQKILQLIRQNGETVPISNMEFPAVATINWLQDPALAAALALLR